MGALANASSGDVIKLAAGTYSNVTLKGLSFANGVTITSADPKKPAVLTDLMISGSKGIKVQNLELSNTKNVDVAFQVQGSSNIVLDNLDVHGANTAAAMNTRLMMIRSSSNVQVLNSEFSNGWHGISMLNNKQVRIEDNYFHDLRTDGVRGGGNSDLTIRANMFTNFHPQPADHPDAIQLWTANTTQASSNIVIDQNVVTRGNGTQIQGIFLRDITGNLPFNNVTVTHNLIEGARGNGIALSGVKTGVIANNTVQGFADYKSGIQMSNTSGVTVTNNLSTLFFNGLKAVAGTKGNVVIPVATDQGVATAAAWLAQHSGFMSAWKLVDPNALATIFHLGVGGASSALSASVNKSAAALSVATPSDTASDDGSGSLLLTPQMQIGAATGKQAVPADVIDQDDGPVPTDGWTDDESPADDAGGPPADTTPPLVVEGSDSPAVVDTGSPEPADAALEVDTTVADDEADSEPANVIAAGSGVVDAGQGVDHIQVAVTGQLSHDDIIVQGFEVGVDKIVLTDARAGADTQAAQTFHFIDTAAFTGTAGEIRYVDSKNGVAVMVDSDGDGVADLDFSLRDVHALSVRDFIL